MAEPTTQTNEKPKTNEPTQPDKGSESYSRMGASPKPKSTTEATSPKSDASGGK